MLIEIDDFIEDFDSFRSHAITRNYKGEINPADGVFYPDISTDIPESIRDEIIEKLGATEYLMFMRLTTKNTPVAPHQAHNDAIMASNTAILYINPGEGGTSILSHKDFDMMGGLVTEEQERIWAADTNNYNAWDIVRMFHAKPNRIVSYPSNWMHRAEPVGGFGDSPENGRLVLVVFYDRA